MAGVSYRPMAPGDYEQLVALWSSGAEMGFSESDTREHFEAYLARNEGCSFVAEVDGRIVGTVLAGEDARRGFINHLLVEPAFRGRGVGSELARLAEEALAGRSPTKAYVFVKHDNPDAVRFWQRRGYYLCDDFCTMRRSLSDEPYAAYRELDERGVVAYARSQGLVPDEVEVAAEEFGDGNMNHIYRLSWDGGSLIVKQSMPHGKIDVSCFEPVSRGVFESRYVRFYEGVMGDGLERRVMSDETMALSAYEDYSSLTTLRRALLAQQPIDGAGAFLGRYLALELVHSSVIGLGIERKKELEPSFSNLRSRTLTEDYILVSPFFDSPDNCVDELTRPIVRMLWDDGRVVGRARLCAMEFVSNKQCLIHGDFHPGNIFLGGGRFVVSDFDFASWGPIAYDLGTMVGNLVISYRTQDSRGPRAGEERERIVRELRGLFTGFREGLAELAGGSIGAAAAEALAERAVRDSFAFAGCTVAGRSYGYCRFAEVTSIADDAERAKVLSVLVEDCRALMLEVRDEGGLVSMLGSR